MISYSFYDRETHIREVDHRKSLTRIDNINHMMRDSLHLVLRDLACSDIEPTVDLTRVGRYDLRL